MDCKVVLAKDVNTGLFYLSLSISSPWSTGINVDYGQQHLFILISYFIMTCNTTCAFRSNTQISAPTRLSLDGIPVTGLSCEGIEQGYLCNCKIFTNLRELLSASFCTVLFVT